MVTSWSLLFKLMQNDSSCIAVLQIPRPGTGTPNGSIIKHKYWHNLVCLKNPAHLCSGCILHKVGMGAKWKLPWYVNIEPYGKKGILQVTSGVEAIRKILKLHSRHCLGQFMGYHVSRRNYDVVILQGGYVHDCPLRSRMQIAFAFGSVNLNLERKTLRLVTRSLLTQLLRSFGSYRPFSQ